jgi:hypothetical protein
MAAPDGWGLAGGHQFGVGGKTLFADLKDAGATVAAEDQPKKPGNEIVVLLAVAGIGDGTALGARRKTVLPAAGAHLAPRSLVVLVTARASAAAIGAARPAIQTAISHQVHVGNDWLHGAMSVSQECWDVAGRQWFIVVPPAGHPTPSSSRKPEGPA